MDTSVLTQTTEAKHVPIKDKTLPLLLVAACALIDQDGRVLIAQRPAGKSMAGLWEFPGGKLDPGETAEEALVRELREELSIETSQSCLAPLTFNSHCYDDFNLLLMLFVCRKWSGIVTSLESQEFKWVKPRSLTKFHMPPADIPLIATLRDLL
jgi:8-oxo-dGTP diphosphatase